MKFRQINFRVVLHNPHDSLKTSGVTCDEFRGLVVHESVEMGEVGWIISHARFGKRMPGMGTTLAEALNNAAAIGSLLDWDAYKSSRQLVNGAKELLPTIKGILGIDGGNHVGAQQKEERDARHRRLGR